MAFFTLLMTLFGLFAIFVQGKEDPILGMITIFTFFWTIYELFFKPETTPQELEAIYKGTSKMKTRDWVEMIILFVCFVWIIAAAGLTQS